MVSLMSWLPAIDCNAAFRPPLQSIASAYGSSPHHGALCGEGAFPAGRPAPGLRGTLENAPVKRLDLWVGREKTITVILQDNDADCGFGGLDDKGWCCS